MPDAGLMKKDVKSLDYGPAAFDEQPKASLADLKDIFSKPEQLETPDMAKAEIVKELMGKTNLNRVTEVSNFDIAMLSSGKGVNAAVKSKAPDQESMNVFDHFAESFLELRVSHQRQGRKEVVDVSRVEPLPQLPPERKGWLRSFV
jgi:hypothetical protein